MLEELQIEVSSQPQFEKGEVVEKKFDGSSSETLVPVVDKSPTKIIGASVSLKKGSQKKITEVKSQSDTDAKILHDLGFSSSRPEPISIFSQRTVDFQGSPYSAFYAAAYQASIEDKFSMTYAKKLFEKALETDPKFFEKTDKKASENLEIAKTNLETISFLIAKIREFDDSMSAVAGKSSIKEIALQKIEKIGPLSPLTPPSIVEDPISLLSKIFAGSNVEEILSKKPNTVILSMCMSVLEGYISHGLTTMVLQDPHAALYPGHPFFMNRPMRWNSPNIKTLENDLKSKGTVFENDKGDGRYLQANLGFYGDRDVFSRLPGQSQIRTSLILSTMFANELLLSSGLGRLYQTPLGNKFGSDSVLFPKTFIGIQGSGDVDRETSYENSLSDFLLVSSNGSPRVESGSKKVLLLEAAEHDPAENNLTTTATNEFAKTVIRFPTSNRISSFDTGLTSCQKACDDGIEFYKILACRDKDIETITPTNMFSRVLEIVKNSTAEAAGDLQFAEKSRIAELALFATLGDSKISENRTSRNMAGRSILFTICSKIAFKLLQSREGSSTLSWSSTKKTDKKKTEVSVENKGTGKKDTFVIETSDVSDKKEESISKIDESVIRMTSNESEIFEDNPSGTHANTLIYGLSSLMTINSVAKESELEYFDINLSSALESIAEDPKSIVSQIAILFTESIDEATKLSQSDSEDSSFISASRLTKSSNLDGASLLSILFESVVNLCSVFATTRLTKDMKEAIDSLWIYNQAINRSNFFAVYDTVTNFDKKIISVKGVYGPGSQHDTTSTALSLIIEGAKNGTFENAYNSEGLIPNLDLASPNVAIHSGFSGKSTVSFLTMTEMMEEASQDRDLPYAALLSFSGKLDYIRQQTQELCDIGNRLAGNAEADEKSSILASFADSPLGKKYFQSLTDASLISSQRRIKQIAEELESPIKRRPRITRGELHALKILTETLASTPSETLNICFLGLPSEFMETTIYPRFSLETGFSAPLSESTIRVLLKREDAITEIESESVGFSFSSFSLVDSKSFSYFSNKKPTNIKDIVNNVKLLNGKNGSQFIAEAADENIARIILENEVKSYLLKRSISLLSPNDFFSENILRNGVDKRDSGSSFLASRLAPLAGLEKEIFSSIFTDFSLGTVIASDQMLALTSTKTIKTSGKQTSQFSKMSFGEAEMFYDVFSSLLFKSSLVSESIFGESIFDRVIAVCFSNNDFKDLEDSDYETIVSGKKVQANDQYASDLAKSDSAPGIFTLKNYETIVMPGPHMVKK
jgi:hypothetical protein